MDTMFSGFVAIDVVDLLASPPLFVRRDNLRSSLLIVSRQHISA